MFVIELNSEIKKRYKTLLCKNGKCKNCNIEKCIREYFIKDSCVESEDRYREILLHQWNNSGVFNITKIYSLDDIIAYENIDGIACYYIKSDKMQGRKNFVFKLLLVLERDGLDEALNFVYKKMNKVFGKFKLTFHSNRKIKIYSPRYVVRNSSKKINYKPYIEVELKYSKFLDRYFLGKTIVLIMIFIICLIALFKIKNNDALNNIVYSIMASIIFTVIIELLSRWIEINNQKYNIDIGNMSTFLYEQAINENDVNSDIAASEEEINSIITPEDEIGDEIDEEEEK